MPFGEHQRRELIREATKRPKISLKELQSSPVEIGLSVHRTTLSSTLHRAGLYDRVARKKSHCSKKNITNMLFLQSGRHVV